MRPRRRAQPLALQLFQLAAAPKLQSGVSFVFFVPPALRSPPSPRRRAATPSGSAPTHTRRSRTLRVSIRPAVRSHHAHPTPHRHPHHPPRRPRRRPPRPWSPGFPGGPCSRRPSTLRSVRDSVRSDALSALDLQFTHRSRSRSVLEQYTQPPGFNERTYAFNHPGKHLKNFTTIRGPAATWPTAPSRRGNC